MKRIDIKTIWFFLTILAFFYELPLINLSFDRLNPRLIDIMTIWGLFLFGNKIFLSIKNQIFKKWCLIVFWFVLCAIISSLVLLEGNYVLFSLLAAFRYIEGLILVKMVLLAKVEKKVLLYALLSGLVFDAFYCFFQYGQTTMRELAPGVYVEVSTMTGPLSTSYFEIAQLIPTAVLFILGLVDNIVKRSHRPLYYIITILCAWPLLFTGSRTGLVLIIVALSCYLLFQGQKKLGTFLLGLMVVMIFVNNIDFANTKIETLSRAYDLENRKHDDLNSRLETGKSLNISEYDNAIALPFIGAGFNIAPKGGIPRIDYGIHSIYLYPLEQAGIVGLVLFLLFLYTCMKRYIALRKANVLATSALSLLIAIMVTGIGAHNFWREFSSGNVNTLIIIFLCLASNASTKIRCVEKLNRFMYYEETKSITCK